MAKTLLQLFNKYIPEDNEAAILNSGIVSRSRVDKEKRCLEVYADFERIISKQELFSIEENVKKAYSLQLCRIRPHYPQKSPGSLMFFHLATSFDFLLQNRKPYTQRWSFRFHMAYRQSRYHRQQPI